MMNSTALMAAAHPGIPPTGAAAPPSSFIPSNAAVAASTIGTSGINASDLSGSVNELACVLNNYNNPSVNNVNNPSSSFLPCNPHGASFTHGSRDMLSMASLHNPMATSPNIGPAFHSVRSGTSNATDNLFDFSIMPSIDYHKNAIGMTASDLYSSSTISSNTAANRGTHNLPDLGTAGPSCISPSSATSRSLVVNSSVPGIPHTPNYSPFSPIKSSIPSMMGSGGPFDNNHSPTDRFGLFDPSGYFYPQYNLKTSDFKTPNMYTSPYSAVMSDKLSYYQPTAFYSQGYDSFETAAFAYASATKPNLGYNPTKLKEDPNIISNPISPFHSLSAISKTSGSKNRNSTNKNSQHISSDKSACNNSSTCAASDPNNPSNHLTSKEISEGELDTRDLAHRITAELKRYSIPQAVFAEKVLGRSQGTLSDLLRNPKPWTKLKSGRETFRKMEKWLDEPEFQRMSSLRVAGKLHEPFVTIL